MTLLASDNISISIGFWFGLILSGLVILGTIGAIGISIKPKDDDNRLNYILGSIVGIVIVYHVVKLPYSEYNLLNNSIWVVGTVTGKCSGATEIGDYEFEYCINGKRYSNCNNAGNNENIKVSGHYKVRVSKEVPDNGRIDFEQPVTLSNN